MGLDSLAFGFDSYRGIELGALISVVAFTLAFFAFLIKYLPKGLRPLLDGHKGGLFFLSFLFSTTLVRLIACFYLYWTPFQSFQWFIFILFLNIYIWWHLFMLKKATSLSPEDFTLESSEFSLRITPEGHGIVTRKQVLIPTRDLREIEEMDFYSSGSLTLDNFKVEIVRIYDNGHSEPIPSTLEKFDTHSTKLLNVIERGHVLKQGARYSRKTEFYAESAFADEVSDAFIVKVNYQTKYMRIQINFEPPRRQNPRNMRVERMKYKGRPWSEKSDIRPSHNFEDAITVFLYEPYVGDQYGMFWEYIVPPEGSE